MWPGRTSRVSRRSARPCWPTASFKSEFAGASTPWGPHAPDPYAFAVSGGSGKRGNASVRPLPRFDRRGVSDGRRFSCSNASTRTALAIDSATETSITGSRSISVGSRAGLSAGRMPTTRESQRMRTDRKADLPPFVGCDRIPVLPGKRAACPGLGAAMAGPFASTSRRYPHRSDSKRLRSPAGPRRRPPAEPRRCSCSYGAK